MTYQPINAENKQKWIEWLRSVIGVLDGKPENKEQDDLFRTGDGNVATAKDLAGNLLAVLTESPVTIN